MMFISLVMIHVSCSRYSTSCSCIDAFVFHLHVVMDLSAGCRRAWATRRNRALVTRTCWSGLFDENITATVTLLKGYTIVKIVFTITTYMTLCFKIFCIPVQSSFISLTWFVGFSGAVAWSIGAVSIIVSLPVSIEGFGHLDLCTLWAMQAELFTAPPWGANTSNTRDCWYGCKGKKREM